MAVHTGMYRYVLFGTRRYEQVQGGTWWYKEQYKEVRDSMYWYVLVCTNPGPTVQPGPGMLPCGWIRCCNSARPIALYWRQVHLMTAMQAQACFNQPLVLPIGGAGIWGDTAEASAATFAAGASGAAGSAEGARRWRKGT